MGKLVQSKLQLPPDPVSVNDTNASFSRPFQPPLPLELFDDLQSSETTIKPRSYTVDELINGRPALAELVQNEVKEEEYRRDLVARLIEQVPSIPSLYAAIYSPKLDGLLADFSERITTDQQVGQSVSRVVEACEFMLNHALVDVNQPKLEATGSARLLIEKTNLLLLELLRPEDRYQFEANISLYDQTDLIATLKNPGYWENAERPAVYNNAVTVFSYFNWLRNNPERIHLGNARLAPTHVTFTGPDGEQAEVKIGRAFLDNVSFLDNEVFEYCGKKGSDLTTWTPADRETLVSRKYDQSSAIRTVRSSLEYKRKPNRGQVPELFTLLDSAAQELGIDAHEAYSLAQINEFKVRADENFKAKERHARQVVLYLYLANSQRLQRGEPLLAMTEEEFGLLQTGRGTQGDVWRHGLVYLLPDKMLTNHLNDFNTSMLAMISKMWWDAFSPKCKLTSEELKQDGHSFVEYLRGAVAGLLEDTGEIGTSREAKERLKVVLTEVETLFGLEEGTLTTLKAFFPISTLAEIQREQAYRFASNDPEPVETVQQTIFAGSLGGNENAYNRHADTDHLNSWGKKKQKRRSA